MMERETKESFVRELKGEVKRRLLLDYDEFHDEARTEQLYQQYLKGDLSAVKFIAEFVDEWRDDQDLHDTDCAVWGV